MKAGTVPAFSMLRPPVTEASAIRDVVTEYQAGCRIDKFSGASA